MNSSGTSATVAVRLEDRRTNKQTSGFRYEWKLDGNVQNNSDSGLTSQMRFNNLAVGTHKVTVQAWNSANEGSSVATRNFYVNQVPSALAISSPAAKQTIQLSDRNDLRKTFIAAATDSSDDSLTYTWTLYGKAANGSWATSGTKMGNGSTLNYTFSQSAGDYLVRVKAVDSHNAAASIRSAGSDQIEVMLNAAPQVSFIKPNAGTSGSAAVGSAVSFDVRIADANHARPQDSDFAYLWAFQKPAEAGTDTWTNMPGSATTKAYSWDTKSLNSGAYKVRITVSDKNGGSTAAIYSLRLGANNPPKLVFTNATTVKDNQQFQLANVNAATPQQSFYVTATDTDAGQSLNYSWEVNGTTVGGAASASNKSLLNQVFHSPVKNKTEAQIKALAEASRHKVIVTAKVTDGVSEVAQNRTLLLNIAPVITGVTGSTRVVERGRSVTFTATVADAEYDTLSYIWKYRRQGSSGAWTAFNGTNTATLSTQAGMDLGAYDVQLNVSDGYGGTVSSSTVSDTAAFTLKQKLGVPQYRSATVGATTITVNWSAAIANAASYNIYYSTAEGFNVTASTPRVVIPGGSATQGTISNLSPATAYYFKLEAKAPVNGNYLDSGASSQQSKVTRVADPSGVSMGRVSPTAALVNWLAPSSTKNILGYTIAWGKSDGAETTTQNVGTSPLNYTITRGLPREGEKLHVKVKARGSNGASDSVWVKLSGGVVIPVRQTLPAPTGVRLSAVSSSSITVTWGSVANAASYVLSYSANSNFSSPTNVAVNKSTRSRVLNDLASGTTYYFRVVAKAAVGSDFSDSAASSQVTQTTNAAEPGAVSVGATKPTSVVVNWQAPSSTTGIRAYEVSWGTTAAATGNTATASGANAKTYTIDKALPNVGQKLYIKVRAKGVSGVGDSGWKVLSGSGVNGGGITMPNRTALAKPTSVVATATANSLTVRWGKVNNANGYSVNYSVKSNMSAAKTATVTGAGTVTKTINSLASGTKYYFTVTANAAAGGDYANSAASAKATKTTNAAAPRTVSVGTVKPTSVVVNWQAPSSTKGVGQYEVVWGTRDGAETHKATVAVGTTSYTIDKNLPGANQKLYIKVRAKGSGGVPDSAWSKLSGDATTMPTKTKLGTPSGISATATASSIVVSWSRVNNANGYEVYYSETTGVTSSSRSKVAVGSSATSATLSGLDSGTTYYYIVVAQAASGGDYQNSDASSQNSKATNAAAPGAVSKGDVKPTSVVINWQAPSSTKGISGYEVSWGTDSAADDTTATVSGADATGYTIRTGLPASGSALYVKVRAKGSSGVADSAWKTLSGDSVQIPPKTKLGTPGSITFSNVSSTGVTVNWGSVTNAGSYTVEYAKAGASSFTSVNVSSGTSRAISGLASGTSYKFKVTANAAAAGDYANSDASSEVRQTTNAAAPGSVTTPNAKPTAVTVNWKAPASTTGISGYEVAWGTSDGSTTNTYTVTSGTSHTITTGLPTSGGKLYIQVRAKGSGSVPDSAWVKRTGGALTMPNKTDLSTPTGIRFSNVSASAVTVNWGGVTNAGSYIVYYSTSRSVSASTGTKVTVASGTSQAISGLASGTSYYFIVVAVPGSGDYANSSPSAVEAQETKTAAPGSVSLSGISLDSVSVSWAAPASTTGIKGYLVSWGSSASADTQTHEISGSSTRSHKITTNLAAAGSTFYVKVKALATSGSAGDSAWVSKTATMPAKAKLATPSISKLTPKTNAVTLVWGKVKNAMKYAITYSKNTNFSSSQTQTVTGGAKTTATVSSLDANTTYYFKVVAKTTPNNPKYLDSNASAAKSAKTLKIKLSTPQNVSGAATSTTSITLSWDQVSNANGYKIYHATTAGGLDGSAMTIVNVSSGSTTSQVISGLNAGTRYYFKLRATGTGAYANSDWSAVANATTVAVLAPSQVIVREKTPNKVVLNWLMSSTTGVTGYTVQWSTSSSFSGSPNSASVNSANTKAYTITTGLPAVGSQLYIRVQANSAKGSSDWKVLSGGMTMPQWPSLATPKITGETSWDQISIRWQTVANAVGYTVYHSLTPITNLSASGVTVTQIDGGDKPAAHITGLPESTTYYFKVRAKASSAAGTKFVDSDLSKEVSFTTTTSVDAPTGVSVSNVTTTSAVISWSVPNNAANVVGYAISWGTTAQANELRQEIGTGSRSGNRAAVQTTHTITTIPTGGNQLYVKVQSVAGNNYKDSAWSSVSGPYDIPNRPLVLSGRADRKYESDGNEADYYRYLDFHDNSDTPQDEIQYQVFVNDPDNDTLKVEFKFSPSVSLPGVVSQAGYKADQWYTTTRDAATGKIKMPKGNGYGLIYFPKSYGSMKYLYIDFRVTETKPDGTTKVVNRRIGWNNSYAGVNQPDPYNATYGVRMEDGYTGSSATLLWAKPKSEEAANIKGYRIAWGSGKDLSGDQLQAQNFVDVSMDGGGDDSNSYTITSGLPQPGKNLNVRIKTLSKNDNLSDSFWSWLIDRDITGYSPVCVLRWRLKLCLYANALSQCQHSYGFSQVCTRRCLLRLHFKANVLSQFEHL
ncbi:MAG: fibronectin type III domain-containing protein [Spirochaetota bacterium]